MDQVDMDALSMNEQEVKQSKSGAPYATAELHNGPRVVSKAVLIRIDHKTSAPELALKVGRYEKRAGLFGGVREVVESKEPKSELSLSGEETTSLLKFLETHAGLVVHGSGSYLKVDDADLTKMVKEIYGQLQSADKDKLLPLVQEGKLLPREVLDMAILRARQDALEEFTTLLGGNATEHDFQKWFSKNSWALGSDCARVLDERYIDVENIADYLTQNYDGHADVIELKRPSLGFWAAVRDHGNLIPHSDLVKAIAQAQNYQFELEREMNSVKMRERTGGCPIAKPRSLLIHGRSEGWGESELRAQRLMNGGFSSLQVLTYDQVFTRINRIVGA